MLVTTDLEVARGDRRLAAVEIPSVARAGDHPRGKSSPHLGASEQLLEVSVTQEHDLLSADREQATPEQTKARLRNQVSAILVGQELLSAR